MTKAALPDNELARLETLRECKILDTSPERRLDEITRLAAHIYCTPIALVSLVDANRLWFKSKIGLETTQTPRDLVFCAHAILQPDVLIVPNTLEDKRFAQSPLVRCKLYIRFYGGVPLITADGNALGALSIMDYVPQKLNWEQAQALQVLGCQAIRLLEKHLNKTLPEPIASDRQRQPFLKQIAAGFSLALAIGVSFGLASYQSLTSLRSSAHWHRKDNQVLAELLDIRSQTQKATLAEHRYLINDAYSELQRYDYAGEVIIRPSGEVRQAIRSSGESYPKLSYGANVFTGTSIDNAIANKVEQQQRLADIDFLIESKLPEIEKTIILRKTKDLEPALIISIAIFLNFCILALLYYFIYRESLKRKRTEAALEQERDFSWAIIDTADAMVVVLDPEGKIVRFNRACEQITAYSADKFRGKYFWDLFRDSETIESVKAVLREFQVGQFASKYEKYCITKQGEHRLIAWSNTALLNKEGSLDYIIVTGTDITERQQNKEALQQSGERFRNLAEQANDWVWEIDLNCVFTYVSPNVPRILGYEPEEILGKTTFDFMPLDEVEQFSKAFINSISKQQSFTNIEKNLIHKDGHLVVLESSGLPVFDPQGVLQGYRGIARDITARKRAEEQLFLCEARFRRMAESGIIGMIFADLSGNITEANDAFVQMVGYTQEELLAGKVRWDEMTPPEYRHLDKRAIEQLRGSGVCTPFEKEYIRKDGSRIPILIGITVLDESQHNCVAFVLDLTERKRVEETLLESQTRLKLIDSISTGITSGMSVEQVIESTVKQMSEYFDTLRVAYSTIDPQGNLSVLHSIEPGAMTQLKGFKSDLTVAPEYLSSLRMGKLVIVENVAADKQLAPLAEVMLSSCSRAVLNVPLQHSEQLTGLLCFDSPEPRKWSDHEIVTLTEVADYLGVAIKEAYAQQERLRAIAALQESEERYRSVIETVAEGIVLQYADGSIGTWNLAAERLLGLCAERMMGRTSLAPGWRAIHEDGSPFPDETHPAIVTLSTGKPQSNVVMGVAKPDGTLSWISINTQPLFRANKTTPYAVVSSFFDITERKQAEEELRLSDEALQQMPDAILLTDLQGKIQKWLGKSEQIFGYTAAEAIGKPINFLHRPDIKEVMTAQMIAEIQETGTFVGEIPCLRKDGSEVLIETTAKTFYDKAGKPLFLIGINRDITERKRTEEELQQANKKLIGWVNELQQRNREIALLGEMSDALQACLTVEQAYSAIAHLVQPLFPALSGGIFALSESRNIVEAVATWGIEETERPFTSKNLFAPNACWALRRGQPHLVEHNHPALLCKHIHRKLSPEECLCVPMMAQGEALGLVYLSSAQPGQLTEAKQQLAVTVAEHIALALANLKLRETLQHQSIRDPLTGLFNRRYMEESLAREIHRVERKQQPLGIIMLDVDHFKQFNDTFGHEAGDEVLREVGLFLQKYIRDADIACRYGGEEFMLILPDTPLEVIQQRAEQLREDIKNLQVQHRHQYLSKIAFSVGVACFPKHGLTADAVIHAADTALYRAKAAGRDRVVTAP